MDMDSNNNKKTSVPMPQRLRDLLIEETKKRVTAIQAITLFSEDVFLAIVLGHNLGSFSLYFGMRTLTSNVNVPSARRSRISSRLLIMP